MIMGHPGGDRAGRLRRQDPRGHGLPRPPEAPGAGPLAARRDEGHRRLQRLPPDRRRQVRRHRLRARLELDVRHAQQMGDIPLRTEIGNAAYLRDVATPRTPSFIQTNVVRVNGRREVYIPVFRQLGASTLAVVDSVRDNLKTFTDRLTRRGIDLKLVMDQSVYVRQAISSLVQEGVLGRGPLLADDPAVPRPVADDGDRRDDAADLGPLGVHLPVLHGPDDQRHDPGRADAGDRADGRQRDHLPGEHAPPPRAGRHPDARRPTSGASEVALPELVSTLCTFLVLAPLALMPGMGEFLFQPMAMAVAFAMIARPTSCRGPSSPPAARPGSAATARDGHADATGPTRRPTAGSAVAAGASPAGRR